MTMYSLLRQRLPAWAADTIVVAARAALIVTIVLFSDHQFADFPYLTL